MDNDQEKLHHALGILMILPILFAVSIALSLIPQDAEKQEITLAMAAETTAASFETIRPLCAGEGSVLDPGTATTELTETLAAVTEKIDLTAEPASGADAEGETQAAAEEEEPEEDSNLVMADVDEIMNVRAEPDASSEKIGVLYKDCGGEILERGDGWTKLKSGDLVGWASNDYLLFGKEAQKLAADVGRTVAKITTDSLRVRKEASMDAHILGLVGKGEELEVVHEDDGSGFIMVDYDGADGFVSAEYAEVSFRVDTGETMEAIKKREEEERKAKLKAKLTANQGAVQTSEDEVRLLGALIQCEAGNQPYEGQLAVGAVVMNRVRSAAYPNTIVGVIYASGQFSPAGSGRVADTYNGKVKDSCIQAARAAIGGQTTVGSALHFRRAGSHDGVVIGGHVFW
ncbi:MAG: cell wall hydrolase [Lachnospiraceae bacterium]|nr:cell wall hydrolase [Lachnospiraceae bacterium]